MSEMTPGVYVTTHERVGVGPGLATAATGRTRGGTARIRVGAALDPAPAAWTTSARCSGTDVDPDMFFAADGERGRGRARREEAALAVCASCPVRNACLAFALGTAQADGIWGGRTERDRQSTTDTRAPA